jgi:hypothetical protein
MRTLPDASLCRNRREKGGKPFPKRHGHLMMRLAIACGVVILVTGCGLLPEVAHQPTIHNPFPQLTKIAVAPFVNLSAEPTVDGRQFGIAYFGELQAIQGFEVVPIGVVEAAIRENHIALNTPADVRRLAQLLEVDAVVLGAVTDYSPYYPPRCGLQIEWYAANPCFHPIPPGYGLPWGTPAEEDIPEPLVMETEMSLAREQLKTQTPDFRISKDAPPAIPAGVHATPANATKGADGFLLAGAETAAKPSANSGAQDSAAGKESLAGKAGTTGAGGRTHNPGEQVVPVENPSEKAPVPPALARSVLVGGPEINMSGLPPDWPDPRGLVPPPPSCRRPGCFPTSEPVLRHTKMYSGTDPDFTASLSNYSTFRDDARFGGWSGYLQRSEDFIRFCCHKHIAEMLTARGGAGTTRVLWRWPDSRYTP